ncbi:hypothetical protein RYX36_019086 [Vicia faba]
MSDEEISNMMATALGISNSIIAAPVDPYSSASTHIPHCEEDMEEEQEEDDQEEEYYDA